jgi:radical SAM protein with 4Fe4S-binding SPASM domain
MHNSIDNLRDEQYNNTSSTYISDLTFNSVEINPIESCTRRCTFCPRSDSKKYPNVIKNKITTETCYNIGRELNKNNFNNKIGFVGFGEPLLHSGLEECIYTIKKIIPDIKWLEVNTNGDLLTADRISSLYDAGCTNIIVSMYDKDITEKILTLRGNIPIDIITRHHYDASNNFNLKIVNRNNITYGKGILKKDIPCYIPFYKLMIDWNGDILPCSNDWSRTVIFGNINDTPLDEIINGESSYNFKYSLVTKNRNHMPCAKCNVCGTLRGEVEFNMFKQKNNL